jgi:4-aminobutyrate aminotransferase-like enzyme
MQPAIQHPNEPQSNQDRESIVRTEPKSLRTYTPTQMVIAKSAGIYHWTPEGRRFYDFTSGVLVANLGHNSRSWLERFNQYLGWPQIAEGSSDYIQAAPLTAYNAITPLEADASRRLLELLRKSTGGKRLEQVMWAASGSEAIQKALWAAMANDRGRPMILATRFGFHGKKGLAGAVTGSENDHDRDPRVCFVSFPMAECRDVKNRGTKFDPAPYRKELDSIHQQYGKTIGTLITEPYLGGGGSYHPPKEYLQLLQRFCRDNDIIFILDEVQSNFGRTGQMFAFETYEIEPDIVVLGKGLTNGVPGAAAVGRRDIFAALNYGEGSDTWSANPMCCAGVLATLDEFAARDVMAQCRRSSAIIEQGLVRLKDLPMVAHVRGELGGMVWGVELRDHAGKPAADWANEFVLACYRGAGGDGIHLLGPLAGKVIRIAPPLVISEDEARAAMDLMFRSVSPLALPH